MSRRPPRSTRTDTLFPYTTLFRSRSGATESRMLSGAGLGTPRPARYPVPARRELRDGGTGRRGTRRRARYARPHRRSEEHTSELQSLMRISYAVFCLKKKKQKNKHTTHKETA